MSISFNIYDILWLSSTYHLCINMSFIRPKRWVKWSPFRLRVTHHVHDEGVGDLRHKSLLVVNVIDLPGEIFVPMIFSAMKKKKNSCVLHAVCLLELDNLVFLHELHSIVFPILQIDGAIRTKPTRFRFKHCPGYCKLRDWLQPMGAS